MRNKLSGYSIVHCLLLGLIAVVVSCKRDTVGILHTGNFTDTSGALKTAAGSDGLLIGLESDYPTVISNSIYLATIAREANMTTFGYEMKHGAIVQNDGSFNYSNTDNQYNAVSNAGLKVFGHNLCWYQNQNATFLNSVVGSSVLASAPNLILNGGFETPGSGSLFADWSVLNSSNGSFSVATGSAYVHSGSSALEATTVARLNNYNTQILSNSWNTTVGHSYVISYWIQSQTPGSIQFELRNSDAAATVQYVGGQPTTTNWTQISYTYKALGPTMALAFDLGGNANIFYIDDVSVIDATAAATAPLSPATVKSVDSLLQLWISGPNGIATRYAGKVIAWDVVNEPMSDATGSGVRTSHNMTIPAPEPKDWFFWSDFLGRDYALYAFQYAKAADPNALLFINDYNLESNTAKLDSLIAYVKELQGLGAKIDGIGTEMHIAINTPYAGIDAAFQALAATGLKVRISELDVRLNPNNKAGFNTLPVDPTLLASQANMYQYVVNSYIKHVPTAQRFGITVWGVDDPDSWIITSQGNQDAPLLFNGGFSKKPAYSGFLQGLKGM